MYTVKIYFHNITEPLFLHFDRLSDQDELMSSANMAMSLRELLTLRSNSGITGIIDSTQIRAIVRD